VGRDVVLPDGGSVHRRRRPGLARLAGLIDRASRGHSRPLSSPRRQVVEPEHHGLSQPATAYRLGLSREALRDRLERACRKIREAGGER
jgi:hypothetical protein